MRRTIAETLEICIASENADGGYRKRRNVVAVMRIPQRPVEGIEEEYADLRRPLVRFSQTSMFDQATNS